MADAVSRGGQTAFVRLTRIELLLLMACPAIAAGIAFTGIIASRVLAATVAILLLTAAIVRYLLRATDPSKAWFEGRAVAESVKTLTWKYITRVSPLSADDHHADDMFTELLHDVIGEHMTLAVPHRLDSDELMQQITPGMRRRRALTFEERRAEYLEDRVRDQLRWYARRSHDHERTASFWFTAGIIAEVAALGYAIVLVASPTWPNIIGLLSTVTAASATLARLRGDNEVAQRYALAAQELATIQHRIEASNPHTFPARVVEAESAISREHTMWAAKRT